MTYLIAIFAYLFLLAGIGIYKSRQVKTQEDFIRHEILALKFERAENVGGVSVKINNKEVSILLEKV